MINIYLIGVLVVFVRMLWRVETRKKQYPGRGTSTIWGSIVSCLVFSLFFWWLALLIWIMDDVNDWMEC